MKINEISVVICNKNSLNYLKKSIPNYKKLSFFEIIVIDGNSSDGSIKYLEKKKIKIISDQGKGLSYSRKLGIINSKGDYIFMAGPDDICNKKFFYDLIKEFSSKNYDAATTLLRISNPVNYWDKCLNEWYKYIRKTGKAKVIGTPTIFKRKVFKKVGYKKNSIGCDDTNISDQLLSKNFNIGVLNMFSNQPNNNNFISLKNKFQLYGKSDVNYYRLTKYKNKFKSFLNTSFHPIKHLFKFTFFLILNFKFIVVPFAFIITTGRYLGFIKR